MEAIEEETALLPSSHRATPAGGTENSRGRGHYHSTDGAAAARTSSGADASRKTRPQGLPLSQADGDPGAEDCAWRVGDGGSNRSRICSLILVTALVAVAGYYRATITVSNPKDGLAVLLFRPGAIKEGQAPVPILGSAPDGDRVADPGALLTFQELARAMVPTLYGTMREQAIPVLVEDVQPADVYGSRKLILKTRDLLDVFSPVYPNATVLPSRAETLDSFAVGDAAVDMWGLVRSLLDRGYEVIGAFQDLDHAHIEYTPQMFGAARDAVVQWRRDWERFHDQNGYEFVVDYLRSPGPDSYRHRESRLFWKTMDAVPAGSDPAPSSLRVLGSRQTASALVYLTLAFQYDSVLGTAAHEHYHDLRKELRSMTDEYDLLGSYMFPTSCAPSIKLFKAARGILGDINDMWTAYDDYVALGLYRSEQKELAKEIDRAWQSFRIWVEEVDFEDAIRNVTLSMQKDNPSSDDDSSQATAQTLDDVASVRAKGGSVPSLQDFLLERRQRPTDSLVIGNEAGDADTIVSSLLLAYVESVRADEDKTPVVAIGRLDLETQRPEVSFLFKLVGISSDSMLCVDDPFVEGLQVAALTLADHNRLASRFEDRRNWTVVEIVDHHQDEREYIDTCSGDSRIVAYADGQALVASACTLVAERLFGLWKPPPALFPAPVGALLLGVILLDSVGLSEAVGKVTQRDRNAVQRLLSGTNWSDLPDASKQTLQLSSASLVPDPMRFFDVLQDSKYDAGFWNSLNVRDALRQDYKSFPCANGFEFGVSSVLMPSQSFFSKTHLVDGVLDYMSEVNVAFLAIMLAFQDDQRRLYRQLAFCSTDPTSLDDLVAYFLSPRGAEPLELREIHTDGDVAPASGRLWLRIFDQRNAVPSRKQIGPILEQYFEALSRG